MGDSEAGRRTPGEWGGAMRITRAVMPRDGGRAANGYEDRSMPSMIFFVLKNAT
jgi:hypothetical protein